MESKLVHSLIILEGLANIGSSAVLLGVVTSDVFKLTSIDPSNTDWWILVFQLLREFLLLKLARVHPCACSVYEEVE